MEYIYIEKSLLPSSALAPTSAWAELFIISNNLATHPTPHPPHRTSRKELEFKQKFLNSMSRPQNHQT